MEFFNSNIVSNFIIHRTLGLKDKKSSMGKIIYFNI